MRSFPRCPPFSPWLLLVLTLALLVMAVVKIVVEWPFAVHEDSRL